MRRSMLLVLLPVFLQIPTTSFAQRSACIASYDAGTSAINLAALDIGNSRYTTSLPITTGGTTVRFRVGSTTTVANKECLDPATFDASTLTVSIPDVNVAGNYFAATLGLVAASNPLQLDLVSASKNPRLVPDAGVRVEKASNPFATVDSATGITYLGYQDRSGGGDKFRMASDGLTFTSPTALTYNNRSVDSRRTLMPDGVTWRLYQVDPTTGVMSSYKSTDGNVFTAESGTRYSAQTADAGSVGVYDLYTAGDGALVLVYVGDLRGKNNLRMARSTDNGLTFTFYKGNVLGDDDAGGGGSSFIDNKTMALPDGRRRMFTMRAAELQSFVTTDGYNWSRESGTRISYKDFATVGLTIYSLNDPVAVIDKNGKLKVYVAASTVALSNEAAGNMDWAIVSATWSD